MRAHHACLIALVLASAVSAATPVERLRNARRVIAQREASDEQERMALEDAADALEEAVCEWLGTSESSIQPRRGEDAFITNSSKVAVLRLAPGKAVAIVTPGWSGKAHDAEIEFKVLEGKPKQRFARAAQAVRSDCERAFPRIQIMHMAVFPIDGKRNTVVTFVQCRREAVIAFWDLKQPVPRLVTTKEYEFDPYSGTVEAWMEGSILLVSKPVRLAPALSSLCAAAVTVVEMVRLSEKNEPLSETVTVKEPWLEAFGQMLITRRAGGLRFPHSDDGITYPTPPTGGCVTDISSPAGPGAGWVITYQYIARDMKPRAVAVTMKKVDATWKPVAAAVAAVNPSF